MISRQVGGYRSVKEILPYRAEYIDQNPLFKTDYTMLQIGRDVYPIAIVDDLFFFTYSKFKLTFGTVCCLGMKMLVKRTNSARLESDLDHHNLIVPAKNFS